MDEEQIIKANNTFSIDLYNKLKEPEKNLFFSPFSIFTALSMAYAGARGLTKKQMKETLHITLDQNRFHTAFKKFLGIFSGDKGSELYIANLLCIQKDFNLLESFLRIIEDTYCGRIWELDFNKATEARDEINAWVAEHTRGKIENIIDRIAPLTILILVNAIYFKGTWDNPFNEEYTEDDSFTLISGEEVLVPMMHKMDTYHFLEENSFQILEMPYEGKDILDTFEQLSIIIFLPKKKKDLDEMEKVITFEKLNNYLTRIEKLGVRQIRVTIPRFKIETKYELKDNLTNLGITDAFTDKADFSGITKFPPIYVNRVIHQAFVEVNERGTEAAAATVIEMMVGSLPLKQEIPEFCADHPFLYIIIDSKTRTILFIGRLVNPKA